MGDDKDVRRCPYCLSETDAAPVFQKLTPHRYSIFEAVVSAGPEGISVSDLLEEYLPGRKPISLRTTVSQINNYIAPLKLKAKGGRYYLDRDFDEEDA